jgi:replicative DNA helicase
MRYQHGELPNNLAAEQGVLGSILYTPSLISEVASLLTPTDFYSESRRHPAIWKAMLSLYRQEIGIDTATMLEQLQKDGITEIYSSNVLTYIHYLWDKAREEMPSVREDARIVKNASLLRRLTAFLAGASEVIAQADDAEAAQAKLQALLDQVNDGTSHTDLKPLREVMMAFLEDLDVRQQRQGKMTGIPTGLADLDALLGGMQRKEFLVLGGLPGEGKTSLMLNFVHHLLSLDYRVAVFSLEMGDIDLARRLVSINTGIDSQIMRNRILSDQLTDRVVAAATDTLASDHIFIDESGDLTLAKMRVKLDRFRALHGGLDLIVVDYLQMMQSDEEENGGGRYHEHEAVTLSKISRGLKKLAKHYDVPVLALASLNRASVSRADKRPQLSDLRGSGSIEFDADVVMFIMRQRERQGYSLLIVEKHRNGPQGEVTLKFNPNLTKFSTDDMTTEEER